MQEVDAQNCQILRFGLYQVFLGKLARAQAKWRDSAVVVSCSGWCAEPFVYKNSRVFFLRP